MRRLLLLCPLALAACSGTPGPADAGPADSGAVITCQNSEGVLAYAPGVSVSGGGLRFELVQSDPAPPARGTNTWTVRVTDSAGAAQPGLSLGVEPFMPEHGHGTSVRPSVTANGDGSYTISNLYFFMPGLWRTTLSDTADGGPAGSAAFLFCIPG